MSAPAGTVTHPYELPQRLRRWRERIIDGTRGISLIRAEAFSEALHSGSSEPRSMCLARGLALTLDRLPARIADGERIVGTLTEKPLCAALFPETNSGYLLKELDNFGERERDRFTVTDEQKWRLREEILPPWLEASGYDEMYRRLSPESEFAMRNVAIVAGLEFGGAAHLAHLDYRRVVDRGYQAIVAEARAGLDALDPTDPEYTAKTAFHRSVIVVAEATMGFARRYADEALRRAAVAAPAQAAELRAIAEVASQVPAGPARSFREALQSFWFVFLALMQTDSASEIPLGRLDQLLYPHYRCDLAAGRLTREQATELLAELLLKVNELAFLAEYAATKVIDGNHFRLTLTLGGQQPDGGDASNEISVLLLAAADAVRLTQPNLAVRLHTGTDPVFRALVDEAMTSGANIVEVFNDDAIVAGFTAAGIAERDARDYLVTGCVQPIPGGAYGPTCAAFVNAPKALEMALNGGAPMLSLTGDDDDRPSPQAESYPQLWRLVADQVQSNVELALDAAQVVAEVQQELLPNPALSILVGGCLEAAADVKSGGARYNLTGVDLLGLGTFTDALAAIDDVVYTRRAHSLDEVIEWCKADFEGYQAQREMLLHRPPKFGNGDPRADQIAATVVEHAAGVLRQHTPHRRGAYTLGLHSETHHIIQGSVVAATPEGRHAGETLSPGASPTSGMAQQGPTAALLSVAGLDLRQVLAGSSVNLRFNPSLLSTPEQRAAFSAMRDAYFQLGGQHLQINVVDVATLRDAQAHPQRYRDLLVRVTGYSARFVDLTLATQEEIIRRTEMGACS